MKTVTPPKDTTPTSVAHDLLLKRTGTLRETTHSTERRFSTVMAEFMKRKGGEGDKSIVETGLVLSDNADTSGPEGDSYVRWDRMDPDTPAQEDLNNPRVVISSANCIHSSEFDSSDSPLCPNTSEEMEIENTQLTTFHPVNNSQELVVGEGDIQTSDLITPLNNTNGRDETSKFTFTVQTDSHASSTSTSSSFDSVSRLKEADSNNNNGILGVNYDMRFQHGHKKLSPMSDILSQAPDVAPCALNFEEVNQPSSFKSDQLRFQMPLYNNVDENRSIMEDQSFVDYPGESTSLRSYDVSQKYKAKKKDRNGLPEIQFSYPRAVMDEKRDRRDLILGISLMIIGIGFLIGSFVCASYI